MKHLDYILLPLSPESSKPKASTNGPSREEGVWPRVEEWSMSSFIRGGLCTHPCPSGPSRQQRPPHGFWPGLPLEKNIGISFCHTKVKCQWQPSRASPGLKHPLFERRAFYLGRGARRSHEMGKNSPGKTDPPKEGPVG